MIEVDVRGDLEYAIRQLKKKLQIDGIKRELKRREYYEKPSVKKRRKAAASAGCMRCVAIRTGKSAASPANFVKPFARRWPSPSNRINVTTAAVVLRVMTSI